MQTANQPVAAAALACGELPRMSGGRQRGSRRPSLRAGAFSAAPELPSPTASPFHSPDRRPVALGRAQQLSTMAGGRWSWVKPEV